MDIYIYRERERERERALDKQCLPSQGEAHRRPGAAEHGLRKGKNGVSTNGVTANFYVI